ncbi:SET domain-containing protein-lysine N-methyltransferase [Dinghuibacter silviterrae]|uniref:SET domain-containing protein n=1 Tax=Dinghuibacter silviterrae TaxID=1539049 RepID=A0A4R8DVK3_9BACT|nr:SET domain-containing protein-lysine N-methyltransferase [Dinghuibacter silviterrae]TDX01505.1 SET domain-containing protein [Dinghuibacter silviterrae]
MLASLHQDPATGHRSLRATAPLHEGQVLCVFSAEDVLDHPTRFTLQIDEGKHILLHPEALWYTNHSCSPNIFFDTETMEIVCLRDVAAGEELAFFYPSTEWRMAEPFDCHCGNPGCLHRISGASVLPNEVLQRYRLTAYVQRKWAERAGRAAAGGDAALAPEAGGNSGT